MGNQAPDRLDFLHRALSSASDWTKFADPKALAVLVLLGLGLTDLLDHAQGLSDAAGSPAGVWANAATVAFWVALVLAACTVILVSLAVFPRLTEGNLLARSEEKKRSERSRFFFGDVAAFDDADDYLNAVRELETSDIEEEVSTQVYAVASVARRKHAWTQRAYLCVISFLVVWGIARLGLALATCGRSAATS